MDWLFKEENYIPKKDKDAFLNKSILSILNILSKIQRNGTFQNKIVYLIHPQLKFISSIIFIIFISLSYDMKFIIFSGIFIILLFTMLNKNHKKKIVSLIILVTLFTSIILIPSFVIGNTKNSLIMLIKIIECVTLVNILSYSTKWHEITKSLKLLFIPDIFIFVMDITIKYIFLLGEISLEMLYSIKCRSIGKNNRKYMSMSGIMGILFLKSKDMSDEMYAAMECRGFTGEYSAIKIERLKAIDYIYILCFLLILAVGTVHYKY